MQQILISQKEDVGARWKRKYRSLMPVAYFLVCMTLARPMEDSRAKVLSSMDPILKDVTEIKPVGIGKFAGALDYNNLSWLNKKILESKGTPKEISGTGMPFALGHKNRYI